MWVIALLYVFRLLPLFSTVRPERRQSSKRTQKREEEEEEEEEERDTKPKVSLSLSSITT